MHCLLVNSDALLVERIFFSFFFFFLSSLYQYGSYKITNTVIKNPLKKLLSDFWQIDAIY